MNRNSLFLCAGLAVAVAALVAASAAARPASAAPSTPYDYDVGLVDYTFWDTVFVGDTFLFNSVLVKNYGEQSASTVPLGYTLFGQDSMPIWEDWQVFDLPPQSDTERFYFSGVSGSIYDSPGVYVVCRCTLAWTLDQNHENDGGMKRVVVLDRPGVEDSGPAGGKPCRPAASLATRLVSVAGPDVTWYTATGSRVRSVAARPGVYFDVQGRTIRRVVLVR